VNEMTKRVALGCSVFLAVLVTCAAAMKYAGNAWIYLGFSVISWGLLLNGFRWGSLFMDTFLGIFLWLGFWLKFSVRIAFLDGAFWEPVGTFDGSGAAVDKALIVASAGFLTIFFCSLFRGRFFRYPKATGIVGDDKTYRFYCNNRRVVLGIFVALVTAVAVCNAHYGIYQRGMQAQAQLPYGLDGIFKWLLQFGFASVAAFIVRYEITRQRCVSPTAVAVPFFETFTSNVSLLSRGMILNILALTIGCWRLLSSMQLKVKGTRLLAIALVFLPLFAASVFIVNYLRNDAIETADMEAVTQVRRMSTPLFLDRWVGIEGVLAVSSSPKLGMDIWKAAWSEKYEEGKLTLYDREFIESPYKPMIVERQRHHYISLPGAIAFFYYPGSMWIMIASVVVFVSIGAAIEIAAFLAGDRNLLFCAVIGQVIAFRFASFGYVPAQSYLLLGALAANILLIYGGIWLISKSSGKVYA
jgi:hypothetical protein